MTTDGVRGDRQGLARDREAPEVQAAVHRVRLPADARSARVPAGQRLQDVHRLRRQGRVHAAVDREGVRHPARAGRRQQVQDEVRRRGRQAGARHRTGASTSSTTRPASRSASRRFIGRRPIMAFGNSDGDFEMLEYTTAGSGPRFGLFVHHTDAEREYAYDRKTPFGRLDKGLDEAPKRGWIVVEHEGRLEDDLSAREVDVHSVFSTEELPHVPKDEPPDPDRAGARRGGRLGLCKRPARFALARRVGVSTCGGSLSRRPKRRPSTARSCRSRSRSSPPSTVLDARNAKAPPRFEVKAPAKAPERAHRADRRHGLRPVERLRRADPHADAGEDWRRAGCSYNQFHTTALCSPTRAALLTRPQPSRLQHGLDHRDGDRLPRPDRAAAQQRRAAGRDAAAQRLQHRRLRQVARDGRLGSQPVRPDRPLADALRASTSSTASSAAKRTSGRRPSTRT